MYAVAGDGLFRIPAMINPEGLDVSFYGFIACALLAFAVSAILAFIMADAGKKPVAAEPAAQPENKPAEPITAKEAHTIYAPVSGKVIDRTDIPDETFASGAMGDGAGIDPAEGVVTAPFDGEVASVMDTGHAVGLVSEDGMELLIHVGVDTVKMNGEGFHMFAKEGQKVKTGEKLLEFDIDKIRKAGFSPVTAVLVTNSDDYKEVKILSHNVKATDRLLEVD